MTILQFINALRKSDFYIEDIYTMGSCYQFYVLLNKMYKGCIPLISPTKDHIITLYKGRFYDIKGIVKEKTALYTLLSAEDLKMVKKWGFRKNCLIGLTECEFCEEPIIFYSKR